MDHTKELVIAVDPEDVMSKDRVGLIQKLFCDNRPIFDNVVAIYVDCEVEFEEVANRIREIVKPCDYVIFETSSRVGEGRF